MTFKMNGNKEMIIGQKTGVSIALVLIMLGILGSAFGFYMKQASAQTEIQVMVENQAEKLNSLDNNLVPRAEFISVMDNVLYRLDKIDTKLDEIRGESHGKREN